MDLSDDTLDAIADRVISRIGLTVPRMLKDSIRVNTTQIWDMNYIAINPQVAPRLRLEFTDTGIWQRWETPWGDILSVHFFPWGD